MARALTQPSSPISAAEQQPLKHPAVANSKNSESFILTTWQFIPLCVCVMDKEAYQNVVRGPLALKGDWAKVKKSKKSKKRPPEDQSNRHLR